MVTGASISRRCYVKHGILSRWLWWGQNTCAHNEWHMSNVNHILEHLMGTWPWASSMTEHDLVNITVEYQKALKMWSYKPINYCYNESQSIEDLPKIDFALFWLNLYWAETLLQIEQFINNIASCTQKYRVHVFISFLTIVVVVPIECG